jgi:cell division protein FtsB
MQDFRKRRNMKAEILRVAMGSAGVVALAAVAFFGVRGAYNMYGKFVAASEARTSAQAQLASLQAQYNSVNTQVEELSSPEGVEAQVRERYGVAKPGEGEIDIVTEPPTTTPAQAPGQSWWQIIWHALFVW